ncbi:sterol desaturase family protein [Colletotrichum graminicola]|uniref:Sterol desaturase family protein n=1 Tax=Colletotrichum graminicola (strain M1.001 / M2 / FGSC 10212) TaxID=645133 RepID=E3QXX9_COLGM|nr:sterol desaturase family protein [Colletotrichum graminicola M1.001]EFQ35717.1 sterol desaturase family protein [Colletotrichum graminicola M1.001]WDK14817.1 sterol desaturase family protein [Colletotrichum graminicola]
MDILLSLPIVSYFLAPSITSWTTSLNLLFFHMTWTTLVLSHGPLKVQLVGVLALRLMFWLVPSLVFLLFDTIIPSIAGSIKTGGASGLPPAHGPTLLRVLLLAIFNIALSAAVEGSISLVYASYSPEPLFRASTALPLPFQLLKHVAFLIAAREVLTYYLHTRVLHGRGNGRRSALTRVAKLHASYAHARAAPPFSLMLFADHPLPFLLHRVAPVLLPALALRPHLLTYFLFVGFCAVEETMAMSGYSIVPGIVMGGIARRTAVHYASRGDGNYGAWGVLDWAHGTSQGQDVVDDMRAEAEKHRVKERGERAVSNGAGFLQDGIQDLTKGRSRKTKKNA